MAGAIADVESTANLAITTGETVPVNSATLGTSTTNTTQSFFGNLQQKLIALKNDAKFNFMTRILTIITGLIDTLVNFLNGFACMVKEATIDHIRESVDAFVNVLTFFFLNPLDPTKVCILWWIIYLIFFILWWIIRFILGAFGLEFLEDDFYCMVRVIDDIDLTGGQLYLTKFTNNVICNCFTIPSLNAIVSYKFAHCNFQMIGGGTVGDITGNLPDPSAQLKQCYDACGDPCTYPISC